MKFQEILEYKIERVEQKQLVAADYSIESFKDDVLKNYSDLLGPSPKIFRGGKFSKGCSYHIDPSVSVRFSQNTSNEAIFLVSTLANWAKYPKRTRSLICSSSNDGYTRSFGNETYAVLPLNGSRIGICSAIDFWTSFPYMASRSSKSFDSIESFNSYLSVLLYQIDKNYNDDSYETFIKTLKMADKKITDIAKNTKSDDIQNLPVDVLDLLGLRMVMAYYGDNMQVFYKGGKKIINEIKYPGETLIQFISDILDPVKNNFKLSDTSNLYNDLGRHADINSNELWTDGPCYLVPLKVYDRLFELKDLQWL